MSINNTVQSQKCNNSPIHYFNKIPLCLVNYIQSFSSFPEQASLLKLSLKFINSSPLLASLKNPIFKTQAIKYIFFLLQLEKDAGPQCVSYLNEFMQINIFSIPFKQWCSITLQDQALILIKFLIYRYETTNKKKFYIALANMEIYQLYYSVLSKLPFKRELKIDININLELKNKLNDIIPLFTIITPIDLLEESEPMYAEIQQTLFNEKIEAFHYKIYDDTSITNAIEYFKHYPNHLYSICNETTDLIPYNESSIKIIKVDFTEYYAKLCKNIKAKTIDCSFSYDNDDLFTIKLIDDYSQVTSFGKCLLLDKDQCDYCISLINSMPRLNTITFITFDKDLDRGPKTDELLLYFLKNISNDIKPNIKKITIEPYTIDNLEILTCLQENFPNLQSFFIEFDDIPLDIQRLYIIDIYITSTSNIKDHYEFMIFLLKNNLRNKPRISFSIVVYENMSCILDFIAFLHKRGEIELLNSFHTILSVIFNYENIEDGNLKNDIEPIIEKLNYIEIDQQDTFKLSLPLLNQIKRIKVILVLNKVCFNEYIDFIRDMQPECLIYLKDDYEDILSVINKIDSLKYLIVSNKVFELLKIENPITTVKVFPY